MHVSHRCFSRLALMALPLGLILAGLGCDEQVVNGADARPERSARTSDNGRESSDNAREFEWRALELADAGKLDEAASAFLEEPFPDARFLLTDKSEEEIGEIPSGQRLAYQQALARRIGALGRIESHLTRQVRDLEREGDQEKADEIRSRLAEAGRRMSQEDAPTLLVGTGQRLIEHGPPDERLDREEGAEWAVINHAAEGRFDEAVDALLEDPLPDRRFLLTDMTHEQYVNMAPAERSEQTSDWQTQLLHLSNVGRRVLPRIGEALREGRDEEAQAMRARLREIGERMSQEEAPNVISAVGQQFQMFADMDR